MVWVLFQNHHGDWLCGTNSESFFFFFLRFFNDLEDMLGFRPSRIYFYLWKYVSPLFLIILITATVVEMAISPPGYNAWIQELVSLRICTKTMCSMSLN